jgi:hypothetical protein
MILLIPAHAKTTNQATITDSNSFRPFPLSQRWIANRTISIVAAIGTTLFDDFHTRHLAPEEVRPKLSP